MRRFTNTKNYESRRPLGHQQKRRATATSRHRDKLTRANTTFLHIPFTNWGSCLLFRVVSLGDSQERI